MSNLGSAPVPALSDSDHVRGPVDAPLLIEYGDLECVLCATLHERLRGAAVRLVFRHFPVRSAHPRAWAAACACEAAGLQGRFWEFHDALLEDQGHMEDPHLWRLAERLALDVERFERDRRSAVVEQRVRGDLTSGVRAGVVTTPTVFMDAQAFAGERLAGLDLRP